MGYSPWGHKESNMTERLTLAHLLRRGHVWSYIYIYRERERERESMHMRERV